MWLARLKNVLKALACDELTSDERAECYTRSGLALGSLLELYTTPEESGLVTKCAAEIDNAVDMQLMDELEARDGLPPMPPLKK